MYIMRIFYKQGTRLVYFAILLALLAATLMSPKIIEGG